jgi:hypothetical protein
MTEVASRNIMAFGLILLVTMALLPANVQGACSWDGTGIWQIRQNNHFITILNLQQTGIELHGTAEVFNEAQDQLLDRGSVLGKLSESTFSATVTWKSGAIGQYSGTINSQGYLQGQTYDKTHPQVTAGFDRGQLFICRDVAAQNEFCEVYANLTTIQTTSQAVSECGYGGPRWDRDRTTHLKWCLTLNGDRTLPNREIEARRQQLLDCVAEKKAKEQAHSSSASLVGMWDSVTSEGINYTLTLDKQGVGSVGAVDPKLDGTIQGAFSADGKKMAFVMVQPNSGVKSRGQIELSTTGNGFDGHIVKDTDGINRAWTGTRRK